MRSYWFAFATLLCACNSYSSDGEFNRTADDAASVTDSAILDKGDAGDDAEQPTLADAPLAQDVGDGWPTTFDVAKATLTKAATPMFSQPDGSYAGTQKVGITSSSLGAIIHYTLDGSTPSLASPTFTTVLSVATTTTIKAIADAPGMSVSDVASASYLISLVANAPMISPGGGTFVNTQLVTITTDEPGGTIYVTGDGSTPSSKSPLYTAPFSITKTSTIKAIVTVAGKADSFMASATLTKM